MYIIRWLMGHPAVAGVVGVLALLLICGSGSEEENKVDQADLGTTTQSIDKKTDLALQSKDDKDNQSSEEIVETGVQKEADEIGSQKVEDNKVKTNLTAEVQSASIVSDTKKGTIGGQSTNISTKVATVELKTAATQVESKETVINEIATDISNKAEKGQSPSVLNKATETVKSVVVDEEPTSSEKERITEKNSVVAEIEPQKQENFDTKDVSQVQAGSTLKAPPLTVTDTVNKTDIKETATTDLRQLTTKEMLLMAREAYWNNGLDEAVQIYNTLIEIEPHVLEYKGELGNVYWRLGYPKKAAELYSLIAIPMIESGNSDRVANMIGFIGLYYPERAAEIHKRMRSKY